LEMFASCPRRYWYNQRNEDPAFRPWFRERGTIIHCALCDKWDRRMVELAMKDFFHEGRTIPVGFAPKDLVKETNEIMEQIEGVRRYIEANDIEVVHEEYQVYFTFAGYKFDSTADILCRHKDTPQGMVEAWDYKTGTKWVPEALNRKLQFGVYYCGLKSKGIRVNRFFWAHTKDLFRYKRDGKWGRKGDFKGPFLYPIFFLEEDMPVIREWVEKIILAIEAGVDYPNPQAGCNMCEFEHICPKYKIGVSTEQRKQFQLDSSEEQQTALEEKMLKDLEEKSNDKEEQSSRRTSQDD